MRCERCLVEGGTGGGERVCLLHVRQQTRRWVQWLIYPQRDPTLIILEKSILTLNGDVVVRGVVERCFGLG